jgi:hypothetical protein
LSLGETHIIPSAAIPGERRANAQAGAWVHRLLQRRRELLIQQYEQLDPATRSLVPLQSLYWPID